MTPFTNLGPARIDVVKDGPFLWTLRYHKGLVTWADPPVVVGTRARAERIARRMLRRMERAETVVSEVTL